MTPLQPCKVIGVYLCRELRCTAMLDEAVPVKDCDFLAPHLKELLPGIGYKTLFPVQVSWCVLCRGLSSDGEYSWHGVGCAAACRGSGGTDKPQLFPRCERNERAGQSAHWNWKDFGILAPDRRKALCDRSVRWQSKCESGRRQTRAWSVSVTSAQSE